MDTGRLRAIASRLPRPLRRGGRLAWDVVHDFQDDDCPRMAAAISYYTIFAMPPLLGLLGLVASLFVDPARARDVLSEQVAEVVGDESAAQVVDVVAQVARPDFSGPGAIIGLIALVFGATAGFLHVQEALNRAWGVAPDPERSGIRTFLLKRALSLLMLVGIGLMVLGSMILSTLVSAFSDVIRSWAPPWLGAWTLTLADWGTSFLVLATLFMLIFRFVPDAVVRWKDAAVGAVFTAVLFTLGKQALGYYLGRNEPTNVYGAAGSLAVALLWVYYSAMILLLGSEFTESWATRDGRRVRPQPGAVRVVRRYGEEIDRRPDDEEEAAAKAPEPAEPSEPPRRVPPFTRRPARRGGGSGAGRSSPPS